MIRAIRCVVCGEKATKEIPFLDEDPYCDTCYDVEMAIWDALDEEERESIKEVKKVDIGKLFG